MPSTGSSILPSPQSSSATTATIFNVITVATTETSQVLPANTKEFIMRSRGGSPIQLAYSSGDTGTLFFTIKGKAVYTDSNFYSSQTVFFQTSGADVVEIIAFT